ncbi:acyl-CoA synthetase [Rhodopseudomonas palustris]|uniref:Acetyl-CoA synthetase n=1 Tax=Rhodopseudomonas palustris TaxID=1076 RepID=A0A418VNM1_RHOPL|nr:AMP-binding protein [Rhodopseudomonas palustris]RJF77796.1 acetyl-CoA synthetase [Rhodopseudomonas palustris]
MPAETYQHAVANFDWGKVRAALGWVDEGPVSLGHAIVDRHIGSDRVALIAIDAAGGERRFGYRELSEASNRFANLLRNFGVVPGDRVAGLMPRGPDVVIAILGALKVGAVYVPVFTGFGPDAVKFRLDHCGAKVLVTHAAVAAQVPADTTATVLCVTQPGRVLRSGWIDLAPELAQQSTSFASVSRDRDDPAALIYTSGSTGQPKGGAIAVNFLAAISPYISYGLDLRSDDVLWPTGDPGWGYGFVCYLGALAIGGTVVTVESNPTPEVFLSILERYGVTNLATTPTLLRGVLVMDEAELKARQIRLHAISSCGEPLNSKVVESFQRIWGLTPMDHFGATEYALPIGNHNAIAMAVKPGSMGLPAPGYRMAIVDDDGRELPAGETGLIAKQANPDCRYWLEYWNDPAATRGLLRNGWIVTGDLGRRDDDGYFWFEGRADDMIKSAGYRIGPFEVESALLKHPAVAEAAVIGTPDDMRGQIVKAFVVLRPGFTGSEELSGELVTTVKSTVGRHQYPRLIEYVAALPKTETGKIQRFALRQR